MPVTGKILLLPLSCRPPYAIESALAAGTSAYYRDKWYVAVPLYSLVLLEGFTLTGNNSQWFSDVIGGGLLGWSQQVLGSYLPGFALLEVLFVLACVLLALLGPYLYPASGDDRDVTAATKPARLAA